MSANPCDHCTECYHQLGTHHDIMGCQALLAVYEACILLRHDRCPCRRNRAGEVITPLYYPIEADE